MKPSDYVSRVLPAVEKLDASNWDQRESYFYRDNFKPCCLGAHLAHRLAPGKVKMCDEGWGWDAMDGLYASLNMLKCSFSRFEQALIWAGSPFRPFHCADQWLWHPRTVMRRFALLEKMPPYQLDDLSWRPRHGRMTISDFVSSALPVAEALDTSNWGRRMFLDPRQPCPCVFGAHLGVSIGVMPRCFRHSVGEVYVGADGYAGAAYLLGCTFTQFNTMLEACGAPPGSYTSYAPMEWLVHPAEVLKRLWLLERKHPQISDFSSKHWQLILNESI